MLKEARALILDPVHWCRNKYAADEYDVEVGYGDPEAFKFCAIGALMRAAGGPSFTWEIKLRDASIKLFNMGPAAVNDLMGHEAVIKIYDEAINGQL